MLSKLYKEMLFVGDRRTYRCNTGKERGYRTQRKRRHTKNRQQ